MDLSIKRVSFRDVPCGRVAKTALPMQGARIPSLIRELDTRVTTNDRSCRNQDLAAAAAAKSLQLCPTLCDPIDSSPPGSPVPGILQARTLEWAAISFSNA